MDTIRKQKKIRGLKITCFKQNETNILCKINMMPYDAKLLCERTKSGLFLNKDYHEQLINNIVNELEKIEKIEKIENNAKSNEE